MYSLSDLIILYRNGGNLPVCTLTIEISEQSYFMGS